MHWVHYQTEISVIDQSIPTLNRLFREIHVLIPKRVQYLAIEWSGWYSEALPPSFTLLLRLLPPSPSQWRTTTWNPIDKLIALLDLLALLRKPRVDSKEYTLHDSASEQRHGVPTLATLTRQLKTIVHQNNLKLHTVLFQSSTTH